MLHYTKQQLTGAGRYSPHVHIGNWNEELKLNEEKIKSLKLRQQQGSLELNRWGAADNHNACCASVLLDTGSAWRLGATCARRGCQQHSVLMRDQPTAACSQSGVATTHTQ